MNFNGNYISLFPLIVSTSTLITDTSKNTHVLLRSCIVDDAKDCSTVYFKGEAFQGCPDKCNSDLCNGKEPDEMRRSIEYKFKKQLIKQPLTIGPLKGKFVPNSPVLSSPDQYYQRNQQRPQQGYPQLNLNSANQFSRGIGGQDEYANQARFGRFDHTPVPQDSFDSNGQSNYGQNNQWRGSQQQFGPGQNNLPNYSGNNNYPNSNYHGNGRGNFYNNNNYNDTPIYPYHQGRSGTGDRGILESISCFFSILEMLIVLMERINVP